MTLLTFPQSVQIVRVCRKDGSVAPCSGDYARHFLGAFYDDVAVAMDVVRAGMPVFTPNYVFRLAEGAL